MGEGLNANSSMLVALVNEMGLARATEVIEQAHGRMMGTSSETDLAAAMATMQPK
jgi:hypothetical protein